MIRELNRTREPEVEAAILGIEEFQRTPLHIDFPPPLSGADYAPVKVLTYPERCKDETFNAVGSRVVGMSMHLPVLDLDRGVVSVKRPGAGFVINCLGDAYSADSVLVDIIGDYGLGKIEVFEDIDTKKSLYSINTEKRTRSIRWRPENEDDFVLIPSTTKGSAHLYIQKPMKSRDYTEFLEAMQKIGAIGDDWLNDIAKKSGVGGVLRTPWTERKIIHRPS